RALVLHPFGDGGEAEPAREIDQGAHEGAVVLRADEIFHEGAVDLDDVDAEIVDGDATAEILYTRDEAARLVDVVDGGALGDLDDESLGDAGVGAQQQTEFG